MRALAIVLSLLAGGPGPIAAAGPPCTVPGTHATVRQAVDDAACAVIQLAAGTYAELVDITRSLTLAGPAAGVATLTGRVQVRGAATEAALLDLRIANGCAAAALLSKGAIATAANVEVVSDATAACPGAAIFADGFESGDTSAWSATVP